MFDQIDDLHIYYVSPWVVPLVVEAETAASAVQLSLQGCPPVGAQFQLRLSAVDAASSSDTPGRAAMAMVARRRGIRAGVFRA